MTMRAAAAAPALPCAPRLPRRHDHARRGCRAGMTMRAAPARFFNAWREKSALLRPVPFKAPAAPRHTARPHPRRRHPAAPPPTTLQARRRCRP
jgi:hypothetical protein